MEKFEKVAEETAYHITAFLVKYADFLRDMAKTANQDASVDEAFDEISATLKGKFMEVLSQKLAQMYAPLYEAGVGHYRAEESYFDIINGGVLDGGKDDLSLVESCLDESGIDKNILDLRVLSGVRISSNLKYLMSDAEFSIESIGEERFDSTWREVTYPRDVVEFGTTPEMARFEDAGAYRPLGDVMDDTLQLAKAYHKTYIDMLERSVERLKKIRAERKQTLDQTLALIKRYRDDARIVPSHLYEEEDWIEADIEYTNDQIQRIESYLSAFDEAANITFRGGKYIYNGAKLLGKSSLNDGN